MICLNCGESTSNDLCSLCEEWGIVLDDVLKEQFHRIGKDGKRYWGRLGGGIVFTDGKKVLLLRRSREDGDYPGFWGIPGGKANEREVPLDTARREAKEECGSNEGQRFGHFQSKDGSHHFHTFLMSVSSPFDVKLSKEHDQHVWANVDDVEDLKLHPKFKENWPAYLRAIKKKFPITSFQDWVAANHS